MTIQSTLQKLGKRVDKKVKQENSKRPPKPNKYWANSMKKVNNKVVDD